MRYWFGVGAVVLVVAAGGFWWLRRDPPPPELGVSQALAGQRAARITDLKYDISLTIPADRRAPISGKLTCTFSLSDTSAPLALDFVQPDDHLTAIRANDRALSAHVVNGHIVLPRSALVRGENTVDIAFTAGDEALNRNDDYLYSLFVPARASLALPVFDQPDLKARWRLRLDVPPDWTAVSNGREAGRLNAVEHVGFIFDETEPLSTYLFAFAAGKFSIDTGERNGRTFRIFHRETDAAKVARNRDAVFDLHAQALAWLESYTAIPYPWGKFDIVLVPSFQFGGMEHAGSIFYNANSLFLDDTATKNQYLGRANVIAHETSHMWFGDLVTMKWFNDVWMKEVFANFMAAKIVNPSFPDVNHDLRFFLQNYPTAYDVDRTDGANPIRQTLDNLRDAGSLYGAIIYQKAPIVMRQLELLMGEGAFRDGLREYLKAHAFANATWPDLIATLDPKTPTDLLAWSHAWVDEPGRPAVRTDLLVTNGVVARLALHEEDSRGRGLLWPQRLRVLVGGRDRGVKGFTVTIASAETEVPGAVGLSTPEWILPTGEGLGYGRFDLDPQTIEFLATRLREVTDPLSRGVGLVSLWESMLDGRVAPARVTEQLLVSLPNEADELNLQHTLDLTRAAFWRYTPADDRRALAARLEPILRAGLARATTTSQKSAWFSTLRSVALTPESIAWLARVWRHEEKVEGLPLAEPDEADLALELAVRDVPEASAMLTAQLDRFKNPDRKARFAFVMPAVSSDAAVRQQFFDSLKDVKNRAREAWVLDAARYLHHPLRAGVSRRLVRPALDLVREIQRTGDIFFPKRWADVTLSGYQSVQTAAEVRAFIEALPADYPPRLRWVLLSSADSLFRAAKILQQ